MAMMPGNIASLLGGFLGRTPGAAPAAPQPMLPTMGSQIAGMGGASRVLGQAAGPMSVGPSMLGGAGRALGRIAGPAAPTGGAMMGGLKRGLGRLA